MDSNFLLQDLIGITFAIFLFVFIFVFPGYVIGWVLNLFKLRTQSFMVQLTSGIFISASVIPALLFLVYRLLSAEVAFIVLFAFAVAAVYIYSASNDTSENNIVSVTEKRYQRNALGLTLLWVLFSIFVLMDLQIGDRLYYSNNAYDMLTRVSVVDAITRTGVPPVNPSYYPGEETQLNYLYYYWYILASVVDVLGGSLVSAFHAMIASISWCGIALFSAVSTYMQVRIPSETGWKKTFIGIFLFMVSGLDCIVIILALVMNGYLSGIGHMEGWNMPIMSWLNAIAWVPHHVTAAIACIFALLILVCETNQRLVDKLLVSFLIGFAFASAFGLSVWVMFVFAIFWAVWAVIMIIQGSYKHVGVMALGGVFAVLFVSPFLMGLLAGSGDASATQNVLPVAFYIRPFTLSTALLSGAPEPILAVANFVMLPLNYLFELGFFFIIAAIWLQEFYPKNREANPIYKAEIVAVVSTTLTLSFLYSNVITINDLGIRGWLPMQIILVVWAVDLISQSADNNDWIFLRMFRTYKKPKGLGLVLVVTMILGIATTGLEAVSLRMWSIFIDMGVVQTPNPISKDDHLGNRTYYARLAYEYIDNNTEPDIVIQNNPLNQLDRPSGLYGTRQMAISDRTIYGVPLVVYEEMSKDVGSIFNQDVQDWVFIDEKCNHYHIDFLVVSDMDPLWSRLTVLKVIRQPIYENEYYAVYSCGY